jgi:hypothetical protein
LFDNRPAPPAGSVDDLLVGGTVYRPAPVDRWRHDTQAALEHLEENLVELVV